MLESEDTEKLIAVARKARGRARATYSNFPVGAAVMCADGRIFEGCNIENAAFGLTMCAERVALFSAVAAGCRQIDAITVFGPKEEPLSPCGACRQVMLELAPNAEVIMAGENTRRTTTVRDLLPDAFGEAERGEKAY